MSFTTEQAVTSINNYSPTLQDNISTANGFLYFLKSKGKIIKGQEGPALEEDLKYAENGTSKWYSGYEILDVSANPVLTKAEFDWKQNNINVVMSGLEELQNGGSKTRKHNLLKARIEVAELTGENALAVGTFADGTGTGGKEMGGLQLIIPDDPTTGTVGGIDRATNSWWRSQVLNFTTLSIATTPTGAEMKSAMSRLMTTLTRGKDAPDVIVCDSIYYQIYKDSCTDIKRTGTGIMGDSGYQHVEFEGKPVIYDANCPASHMYFMNSKYLQLKVGKNRFFQTDKGKMPYNQDAKVIPLYFAGNFTCSNSNLQGVLVA